MLSSMREILVTLKEMHDTLKEKENKMFVPYVLVIHTLESMNLCYTYT